MDYQAFLRQLESSTLPASEFTHQAHLYAAWAYRRQYPAAEAAARCARALSRYAMAQGRPRNTTTPSPCRYCPFCTTAPSRRRPWWRIGLLSGAV
jgi:hypothetical protein